MSTHKGADIVMKCPECGEALQDHSDDTLCCWQCEDAVYSDEDGHYVGAHTTPCDT